MCRVRGLGGRDHVFTMAEELACAAASEPWACEWLRWKGQYEGGKNGRTEWLCMDRLPDGWYGFSCTVLFGCWGAVAAACVGELGFGGQFLPAAAPP